MHLNRKPPFQLAAVFLLTVGLLGGTAVTSNASVRPNAGPADYIGAWVNVNETGNRCSFGTVPHWSSYCNNFNDVASSIWNDSSTLSMNVYIDANYQGAWACISPRGSWTDLTQRYFSWGSGKHGYGAEVNDQISSSKLVNQCGQP